MPDHGSAPDSAARPGPDSVPDDALGRRLEELLLGGPRRYSRAQVCAATGVSRDRARQLWLAMGFAETGDDDAVFTDADVGALQAWTHLVSVLPGLDDEVAHARAMGQALSRLAEWQAAELITQAGELAGPGMASTDSASTDSASTDPAAAVQLTAELLPVVERLQTYVWRRHLAAAASRVLPAFEREPSAATVVVGFADIAGYTRLSRQASPAELAAVLEAFEEDAAEAVASHHGRVVKTVGDEVLFVADQPGDGARIALHLTGAARAARGLPALRVGMAAGPVLNRFGDVYGPVVNVAARLTGLARPGTVLVDRELAAALRPDPDLAVKARRPSAVRGYRHLQSWSLRAR
jgi:adenylate cyclase